ncbi:MAG: O-methyltransferase, partial [Nocardioidaceae bacterium]
GFPSQRVRLIPGAALEVLPRLTDEHYDLVFCDGDKQEYPQYLEQALRLLRPGGVVAFDNSLWHDRVADPSQRDADTVAIRETLATVAEDDGFVQVLLPVGDGLLLAQKKS